MQTPMDSPSAMRVYVAAPYASAGRVRDVHQILRTLGCNPISHWAELATEAEHLTDDNVRAQAAQWKVNVQCLDAAEVLLALSEPEAGGEFFAEVGRAISHGKPVLWTGPRRILSCYADGVVLEACLDDALDRLAQATKVISTSRRDYLLAGFHGVTCPRCKHLGAKSTHLDDGSPAWRCFHCNAIFARLVAV